MLASLVGFLGDIDRAEEAVQEAFAIAAERWPRGELVLLEGQDRALWDTRQIAQARERA